MIGTEPYERSRRQRKKVEMLFAHLKRHLGFERLRLRGLSALETSSYWRRRSRTSEDWRSWLDDHRPRPSHVQLKHDIASELPKPSPPKRRAGHPSRRQSRPSRRRWSKTVPLTGFSTLSVKSRRRSYSAPCRLNPQDRT
ncbi:MAG TPA: transposase [Aestuariivirgaceae bacterium]